MDAQLQKLIAALGVYSNRIWPFRHPGDYKVVHHDFEDDHQDQESTDSKLLRCSLCDRRLPAQRSRDSYSLLLMYGGWILSVILVFVITLVIVWDDHHIKERCFAETSSHSPILSQVPHTLSETTRNGSIRWPSPYRGDPSPEVDMAWDRISIFRPLDIKLTEEEFLKVGKSPETAAKNAEEFGGGFFLQPEFSHQLHCVNLLRKASHYKYEYYLNHDPDFRDKPATFKVHFDHCVEMLRQFVMCHADVGVVTAHYIEARDRPWPDFNTKQTCRDFDAILEWTVDHQMPEGTPLMPLKPAGAKALASPP